MRLTRQEDVSLYLYVRDTVVGPQYAELSEAYTLTSGSPNKWDIAYDEPLGDFSIHPFKRGNLHSGLGRGLLYFDIVNDGCCFGVEQTDMVRVYSDTLELTPSVDYYVNYITGQIYSSLDLTDFLVDYHWNYVSVIDSWPYDDVPALPIVAIEMQRSSSAPLQLGGGDIRGAEWNIEIFANNKGERDDLMDTIYGGIYQKRCPIYTFLNGVPLLREGLFNPAFTMDFNSSYPHLAFEKVEKQLTGLPRWGFYENETINKYRASITFETLAYRK